MTASYTLQGRVTDDRGQGLPGVTVLLGGTTLGTATDADGGYSLAVQVKPGTYLGESYAHHKTTQQLLIYF